MHLETVPFEAPNPKAPTTIPTATTTTAATAE